MYGYALQNPGRWTDPRGEFVVGALGGALASAVLQLGVNMYYGNMSALDAARCINIIPVATGAAFGGAGFGLFSMTKAKNVTGIAKSRLLSSGFNSSAPTIYVDEPECGCELENSPDWAKVLRNLALI